MNPIVYRLGKLFSYLLYILVIAVPLLASATTTSGNLTVTVTVPTVGGGNQTGGNPPPPPPPTDQPPAISNVSVATTPTSATITWDATDDGSVAAVTFSYGTSTVYGTNVAPSGTNSFSVALSALSPQTTYYYQIAATDNVGLKTTQTGSFVTPPSQLTISGVQVQAGITSATITWQTDRLSDSQVIYSGVPLSSSPNYDSLYNTYAYNVYDSSLTLTHQLVLGPLLPNMSYHFKAISTDALGNSASSPDQVFTTLKNPTPPPNVGNIQVATSTSAITLNWSDPRLIAPDIQHVLIIRTTGGPATNPAGGQIVYISPVGTTFTDTNVVSNVVYYYTFYTYNTSGNYSSGVWVSAWVSNGHQAPVEICNNGVDDNGNGLVDCADPACTNAPNCRQPTAEICDNGIDDDGNGLIDCADPACGAFPGCFSSNQDNPNYQPPNSTVPGSSQLGSADIVFLGGNRQISFPSVNGTVSTLAASAFTIELPAQRLYGQPKSITLVVGGKERYIMTEAASGQFYYADFQFPSVGSHAADIEIDYGGGSRDTIDFYLNGLPAGRVTADGQSVAGADVALLDAQQRPLSLNQFGEGNPSGTTANGTYGWVVPDGNYYVRVQAAGYYTFVSNSLTISNHVVNVDADLLPLPPPLPKLDPNAPLDKNLGLLAQNLSLQVGRRALYALRALNQFKANQNVQKATARVVVPTVVTAAAVSTALFVSWVDLLPFLRFLFLQPLLLLGRGRRKGWGLVYNALNKQPIDLATLRLVEVATDRIVQTKVTDKAGRYVFVANPGKYRIDVQKNSMVFPSALLQGYAMDGNKTDLYHGEVITVSENNAVITANIPLDPFATVHKPLRLRWYTIARYLKLALSWSGIIVTAISAYIAPHWYVFVLLAVHLVLFVVFRRLAIPPKIKSWGIVYDVSTRQPLGRTIARLFNAKFNKLVDTQVTDQRGRYYFLAGDDDYYVTYEHEQYQPEKTNVIDLKGKESSDIALDVGLKKSGNEQKQSE